MYSGSEVEKKSDTILHNIHPRPFDPYAGFFYFFMNQFDLSRQILPQQTILSLQEVLTLIIFQGGYGECKSQVVPSYGQIRCTWTDDAFFLLASGKH